jgi:hypothetical protein
VCQERLGGPVRGLRRVGHETPISSTITQQTPDPAVL